MERQSFMRAFGRLLSGFIGILLFVVIVAVANALIPIINVLLYGQIVGFINDNIILILMGMFLGMIGETFFAAPFPFDLPAPIFASMGSVFSVAVLFNLFAFIDNISKTAIFTGWAFAEGAVIAIVFMLVFIVGYVRIFSRLFFRWDYREVKEKDKVDIKEELQEMKESFVEFMDDISDELKYDDNGESAKVSKKLKKAKDKFVKAMDKASDKINKKR